MLRKNAQGLPVNVVVMLIIGIIIFGLGLGLFNKISSSGDAQIDDITNQIRTGIQSLECDGETWICAPSYEVQAGKVGIFTIYLANQEDENANFKINFKDAIGGEKIIEKEECGEITIRYPFENDINRLAIQGFEGGEFPFQVITNKVKKTPCTFVATAVLNKELDSKFEKTTAIIIKVK